MLTKVLFLGAFAVLIASGVVSAAPVDITKGEGPEVIPKLNSNNNGQAMEVPFQHRKHQQMTADVKPNDKCNTCHFQESAEEKANPMKLVTQACLPCHQAVKKAGKPSGPTSCKEGCHGLFKKEK